MRLHSRSISKIEQAGNEYTNRPQVAAIQERESGLGAVIHIYWLCHAARMSIYESAFSDAQQS